MRPTPVLLLTPLLATLAFSITPQSPSPSPSTPEYKNILPISTPTNTNLFLPLLASNPMMRVNGGSTPLPTATPTDSSEPRIMYELVTETTSECDCESSSALAHIPQSSAAYGARSSALFRVEAFPSGVTAVAASSMPGASRVLGASATASRLFGTAGAVPSGVDAVRSGAPGDQEYQAFEGIGGKTGPGVQTVWGVSGLLGVLMVLQGL
ncbi:uncharacterized protein BDW43DRAFT_313974 [Aspergillus alliaceus]|uniref:uncharacterized protein n=1 Tax=Petromyces alliaceus TaxID=209559 RepID=UPI0012A49F5B|nr:uncharacterized protein BDW43DRAFT_313974 [Aspergillus alliaceus]KAB8230503.1 hypothetical protein BDW43DRAFT_313974 [Aspergillus alliaceus]